MLETQMQLVKLGRKLAGLVEELSSRQDAVLYAIGVLVSALQVVDRDAGDTAARLIGEKFSGVELAQEAQNWLRGQADAGGDGGQV